MLRPAARESKPWPGGTPPPVARANLDLDPDALAPSKARELLAEVLDDRAGSEWLARAQLALSEIVTNAVRHGGDGRPDPITLSIERGDGLVTVSVIQRGSVPPRPSIVNMPAPWSTSGYGLGIVDSIADRWGVRLDPPSVWFELQL
jgi:anti-sigma regulatory factor (Ser/Thr protein kinase)